MNSYIHPTSVIDEGALVGEGVSIWHFCHLMPGCSIGNFCIIGQNVFIDTAVKIGNGVKVQNNVSIYKGVIIEDEVFLGPSMVFTNVSNPRSFINRKSEFKATLVRRGATIGANATIICGVEIGEYAMVGAGAVVTKDILPFALVKGNPSMQIGWVSEAGMQLHFKENQMIAECPQSKIRYELIENRLIKLTD